MGKLTLKRKNYILVAIIFAMVVLLVFFGKIIKRISMKLTNNLQKNFLFITFIMMVQLQQIQKT